MCRWIRLSVTLWTAALFVVGMNAGAQIAEKRTLVWVEYGTNARLRELETAGYDIWESDGPNALVYASEAELSALSARGLTAKPAESDLLASATRTAVDGYLTFDEYVTQMQAWAATHPSIVSLSSLGNSIEGRPLWMLKISDNVATDEAEPEVILIGLQHAREWLGGMTLRGVTEHLITGYTTSTQVADLVNSLEIHVLLVSNPDGFVYTHTTDRLWRKNRRNNGDGTYGVDTNRNWPLKWELAPATPSSATYRGVAPLSEPENSLLNDFIVSRGPSLVGLVNYHSYGNLVLHNWAWTFQPPPNAGTMGPLAQTVATAIQGVNGEVQYPGAWAVQLGYSGGGVADDYLHSQYGILALTLEGRPRTTAQGGFTPAGSMIAPTVAEHIQGAMAYLAWVRDRATDASAPVVSNLSVILQTADSALISWTTDDPADAAVEFGTTTGYGAVVQPNRLRSQVHSVQISGLLAGTTYQVRARSSNLAGLVGYSGNASISTETSKAGVDWHRYE